MVAVVAIACLGNRFAGALAAISAAVWFDFFLTVQYNRLTISRSADLTTFVLLLAVGVAVSQMASWARRLKAVTVADAGYFNRIVSSAVLMQQAGTPFDVVEHVRRQLIEVLGLQDCRFEYGKLLGQPPRLEPDGSIRTRYGYYPVDSSGLLHGRHRAPHLQQRPVRRTRFMLTPKPGARPSQRARLVAVGPGRLRRRAPRSATAWRTRHEAALRVTALPFALTWPCQEFDAGAHDDRSLSRVRRKYSAARRR